jgi:hypothetical protein
MTPCDRELALTAGEYSALVHNGRITLAIGRETWYLMDIGRRLLNMRDLPRRRDVIAYMTTSAGCPHAPPLVVYRLADTGVCGW